MLRLELSGISKQYPAVRANDGVSLCVAPGQIHAVLGENGAGKSTLMKIIYGAVRPDEGEIFWNGRPVQIASPKVARGLGIAMVFQHFSLFDTLTAAENVWLGRDKALPLDQVIARIRAVGTSIPIAFICTSTVIDIASPASDRIPKQKMPISDSTSAFVAFASSRAAIDA